MESIPYDKRSGKIWFNGDTVEWKDANIHILNHGLHYASCVFEGERVYDGNIARLKLPSPLSLNWIKSTADPAEDFEYPLKGPYFSLRDGNSEMAKLAIHFCKKAELLPAVLVLPIQSEDLKKLRRLGLLYQKISKNFESYKVDENLTLVSTGRVPIPGGLNSKVSVFRDLNSLTEHYAIEIGILDLSQPVLTRLHSACFTGDILHSLKCDCEKAVVLQYGILGYLSIKPITELFTGRE